MANLNTSGLNSLKPGILNVSTNDQPLSSGFPESGDGVFVEDGLGVKSALRLGVERAECLEPTTKSGITNVSFCDRTYARIRDIKLLSTALSVYREEIDVNVGALITPLTDSINGIESSNRDLITRTNTIESSLDTFLDANVNVRLAVVESQSLSTLGGQMVGSMSFASTASLSLGLNRIRDVGTPTATNDAATKSYVDDAIAALRAELS